MANEAMTPATRKSTTGSSSSGDISEPAFRVQIRAALTSTSSSAFCRSLRGLSDAEVKRLRSLAPLSDEWNVPR